MVYPCCEKPCRFLFYFLLFGLCEIAISPILFFFGWDFPFQSFVCLLHWRPRVPAAGTLVAEGLEPSPGQGVTGALVWGVVILPDPCLRSNWISKHTIQNPPGWHSIRLTSSGAHLSPSPDNFPLMSLAPTQAVALGFV